MDTLNRYTTQNNSVMKVLFAILFIVLPFVGFYLGYIIGHGEKQTSELNSNESIRIESTKEDNIAQEILTDGTDRWKVYADKDFTFSYPSNWTVTLLERGYLPFDGNLILVNSSERAQDTGSKVSFSTSLLLNESTTDIKTWWNKKSAGYATDQPPEEVMIDGSLGLKKSESNAERSRAAIFVENNGKVYVLDYYIREDTDGQLTEKVNNIISSFKFQN